MRTLLPRNDHVLIKPDPPAVRGAAIGRESRIIMPEQAEEPARTGKVLAVGPKVTELKLGATVLFGRYSGVIFDNVEFGGEFTDLRLMKESEIECVL
jgi:co-chaperonin GroES (HSP10)